MADMEQISEIVNNAVLFTKAQIIIINLKFLPDRCFQWLLFATIWPMNKQLSNENYPYKQKQCV
jgi:hypothetical protein